MATKNLSELHGSDTTDATDTEHDCTCSALMPCFQCYRADRRGRPAVRRSR